MATASDPRLYRFEPLDTSGVFLGLGIVQCVLVLAGILLGIAAITSEAPLPVAVVPPTLASAAAFARVRGRRLWEHAQVAAGWLVRSARARGRWRASLPLLPAADGGATCLPPWLDGIDVIELPWRGTIRMGVVRDKARQTLTALVRVTGPQFVVRPRAEQEHLLAAWGEVLNQFAVERGAVVHVTWSDFAQRSGLDEHRAWLDNVDHGETNDVAAASYRELLGTAADVATTHDIVVSITVARERVARRHRTEHDADAGLHRLVAAAMESLLRSLRSAGLGAGDPLTAGDVHRLLRTRIDPAASRPRAINGRLVDRLGLDAPATAGPMAANAEWRQLRLDGAWHRSYWVEVWPRLAVPPSWFEGFLSAGGVTRAMTVVFCPVPAHQSRRRIERDLVKLETDATAREEKGRRVDARHRRATQSLLDREQELVAGFAEMGYVGLVTVTASTMDELEDHAEIVEQIAREAGMELRLLDARQDVAWAASLPFGLAPRTLIA